MPEAGWLVELVVRMDETEPREQGGRRDIGKG